MTLAECIARHEARQAAIPQTTLTPKGAAVQTALRLRRLLAHLEPTDRTDIVAMLAPAPASA